MKLNIAGPAYAHPSVDPNFQRCVNMFLKSAGPAGRGNEDDDRFILVPTQGLKLFHNFGVNPIRGLYYANDLLFVVYGNSVYKVTLNEISESVATTTLLGTITTSTGTVSIASNPTQVIFVDGTNKGYIYDLDAETFTQIADGDFPASSSVTFIDGYFIVTKTDTGQFFASALNDGTSWDAADVATAESSTDELLASSVSKGELWLFGESTTEIWYNAGNASGMPLSARVGLQIQIGCGAKDSVAELDDLLIWLDNRGYVVQSNISPLIRESNSGYKLQIISTPVLTEEWLTYDKIDDAKACTYSSRGQLMYQITFPTAKKTWVYSYSTGHWHERSYYNDDLDAFEHHLGEYSIKAGQLQIMGGSRDGKIYLTDSKYYDDAGQDIYRIRTLPPIYKEFELIGIDGLEIRAATGEVGTTQDPYIKLRFSTNGGHTWSQYLDRSFGKIGEYNKSIRWNRLGNAREWVFEFSLVDDIEFSILDGSIEVSEIGT